MLPDLRFQHHGEPVETREQWAARRAAAAADALALAEVERRAAEVVRLAAEAERARARPHHPAEAGTTSAQLPHPAGTESSSARPRRGRRARFVAVALVLVCAAGGIIAWASREAPSPTAVILGSTPATATPSPPHPNILGALGMGAPPARSVIRDPRTDQGRQQAWADAPTIPPQSNGWWCICYKAQSGVDHTACRRLAGECTALLEMVQTQGTASIRRGSASPSRCRYVSGPYPWDRLGHRGAWTASSFTGATQAPNICAL